MPAKILIVEDEMLIAMEMESVVDELGHTSIGVASDTATALALAASGPDLALVDLHLRDGLTGPRLARELIDRGIAVVFVTANPRMVATGIRGALGVIEKPTDETTLEAVIAFFTKWRKGLSVPAPAGMTLFS